MPHGRQGERPELVEQGFLLLQGDLKGIYDLELRHRNDLEGVEVG